MQTFSKIQLKDWKLWFALERELELAMLNFSQNVASIWLFVFSRRERRDWKSIPIFIIYSDKGSISIIFSALDFSSSQSDVSETKLGMR